MGVDFYTCDECDGGTWGNARHSDCFVACPGCERRICDHCVDQVEHMTQAEFKEHQLAARSERSRIKEELRVELTGVPPPPPTAAAEDEEKSGDDDDDEDAYCSKCTDRKPLVTNTKLLSFAIEKLGMKTREELEAACLRVELLAEIQTEIAATADQAPVVESKKRSADEAKLEDGALHRSIKQLRPSQAGETVASQ
jgi:hypothetical protein